MTALRSGSTRDIFRRMKFDNCNLFQNLVLIFTIVENPISHMYKVVKELAQVCNNYTSNKM